MSPERGIPASLLDQLFPFHFSFDRDGRLLRVGPALRRIRPEIAPGGDATAVLRLQRPARPLEFGLVADGSPTLVVVETVEGEFRLRGQFLALDVSTALFVGTPWVNDLSEMQAHGITLSDLPPHTAQAGSLFLVRSGQVAVDDARRLVRKLDAANLQLRAVLETAAEGIITMGVDGIVRSFNAAASNIFGYAADEVVGRPVSMIMPPDVGAAHAGYIQRYVEGGGGSVVGGIREVTGLHRMGHRLALELAVSEARAGEERIFTGIVRELLERKRADRNQRAQVGVGRALLLGKSIGEVWQPVAGWVGGSFGFDVALLWMRAESGRLICMETWALDPPRFSAFLQGAAEWHCEPGQGPAAEALASGVGARVHDLTVEGAPHHPEAFGHGLRSGVVFPVFGERTIHGVVELLRVGPLRGDPTLLPTLEAIGGNLGLAVERARALRIAEESVRAREEFLAHMSHEIRTPLSAVIGLAYLLEGAPLGDAELATVRRLRYSADVLRGLVSDVLDFAKLTAGQLELVPQASPLAPLLSELTLAQEPLAREKELTLSLVVDPRLPERVVTDPIRLTQVLMNLVSNAIKYTERGGVTVRATVLEKDEEHVQVRFAVEDTGPGISREDQERVFEAYIQAHDRTSVSVGGTGLGLAIVQRLVGLMGGSVSLESTVGVGSTFQVTLPFAVAVGDTPRPAQQEADTDLAGLRLLVADDSEMNRFVASRLLREAGAEVTTVENGREALQKVLAGTFDLVLMDIQMPEMDGYEATQAIREALGRKAPPIAALTARASVGDRQKVAASGMVDMIVKPFHPEALKERVAFLAAGGTPGRIRPDLPMEAPRAATIQRSVLMTQALDDPVFAAELLELFIREATEMLAGISEAVAVGDPARVERLAHTLKSQAGTIGAPSLQKAMEELEHRLRGAPTLEQPEVVDMAEAAVALGRSVLEAVARLRVELESGQ